MVWSTVEGVITKALHYSTPLSYAWLFLLFTFRSFIVAVVGGSVYGDESVSWTKIMKKTVKLGFSGQFQMRYKSARLSKRLLQPIFSDLAHAILGLSVAFRLLANDHFHGLCAIRARQGQHDQKTKRRRTSETNFKRKSSLISAMRPTSSPFRANITTALHTGQTKRSWTKSARDMASISWRKKPLSQKKESLMLLGRRESARSSLCIWSRDSAWNAFSSTSPTFSSSSRARKQAFPPCGSRKNMNALMANSRQTPPAHRIPLSHAGWAALGKRQFSCFTWPS